LSDNPLSPQESCSSGHSRILDQAEHLFRTSGYNTVTMRDIAREVGIRQASLYYHFSSKEQLFMAVTERMLERHRRGLQQAIHHAAENVRSQLHAAGNWFISQPPIYFLSMVHTDMPSLGEENIQRLSQIAHQSIFEPLRQTFVLASKRGEIRDIRPELLAGFFLSVIEAIPYATTWEGATPKEVMVNEMISVLLDGLKPQ
jgi:TetR/AcrR family transcriptional regulator, cholesterol catabolism regulator